MADFEKAWLITSSWEGPWKPYEKRDVKADKGDYIPDAKALNKATYVGTSYGLTAEFMADYRNWKADSILKNLPKMPINTAANHWKETRWKWIKGNDITDQSLATLIFDYYVQQNITAIKAIAEVLIKVYAKPNFSYTPKDLVLVRKYKDEIDPNHPKPNDGVHLLTDTAVQLINNAETQEILFNLIKAARIKTLGNKTRVKAFVYNDIKTQAQYEAMQESAKKRGLKVQNQPELNADTEGGYVKPIVIGIALYFGYKWFKNRKNRKKR